MINISFTASQFPQQLSLEPFFLARPDKSGLRQKSLLKLTPLGDWWQESINSATN